MSAIRERHLPGIRFEAQSLGLREALPRMDIPVFVGFAASGPLNFPVAIDDLPQFEEIFGPDAWLPWDELPKEPARSLLGGTVRSFFVNGGRRCWIVRLAGKQARSNCFPVPGLVQVNPAAGDPEKKLQAAFALARSEGSWPDDLVCATGLREWSFPVDEIRESDKIIITPLTLERAPRLGDLLRFECGNSLLLFAAVVSSESGISGASTNRGTTLRCDPMVWIQYIEKITILPGTLPVEIVIHTATASSFREADTGSQNTLKPAKHYQMQESAIPAKLVSVDDSGTLELGIGDPLPQQILPGMLLRLEITNEIWWFSVERVGIAGQEEMRLFGRAFRPAIAPEGVPTVNQASVLEFDLSVKQNSGSNYLLRNLGFTKDHARYWNNLPDDEHYYGIGVNQLPGNGAGPGLGRTPDGKRFPLAGADVSDALFLPLGMDSSLARRLGPCPNKEVALIRDGMAPFEPGIFLDEDMTGISLDQFMSRADYLRYLSPRPRRLRGIHAALGWQESSIIEEATLIAVPDAVHCPWNITSGPAEQIQESATPSTSEPSETPESPPVFESCVPLALDSPVLSVMSISCERGDFRLNWNEITQATSYRLQESAVSDFDDPAEIYAGESTTVTLFGRDAGIRFYRVRAEFGQVRSAWSESLTVNVADFIPPLAHNPDTLLIVQRALMRMCAARGDLLAVLSLPLHYDEAEAISHADSLRRFNSSPDAGKEAFASHEAQALSYGALYYPWIVTGNGDGGLKNLPPEGAACGVFARRAIARGAWVAPANEPLREVLALLPRVSPKRFPALQLAQINVIRQDPRGFLSLSADTLSEDIDVRPINVRRLLILLRRLAIKHGTIYVFEPNNGVFRRTVQGGFEALLYPLYLQGAFAGKTQEAAYRVNTGTEINTPVAGDQGRFYVELQVAPSLPLTFLTVRLVQTGDRLTVISEGG